MFTPGQLIRQLRLRRGLTQDELAEAAGVNQGAISKYEADLRYPSWGTLCRLLAAMGMQPRAVAEPCDLSQHGPSAVARIDADERALGTPPVWADSDISLAEILRPNVSEAQPRLYDVIPILELLSGLSFVFVGRLAMRLQGLGCSVPRVEAVVSEPPGPVLWQHLTRRLAAGDVAIWSPELERYCWEPGEAAVVEIGSAHSSETAGRAELSFRTRETATELRIWTSDRPLPRHVTLQVGRYDVPLLAVGEFAGYRDPEISAAMRRLDEDR